MIGGIKHDAGLDPRTKIFFWNFLKKVLFLPPFCIFLEFFVFLKNY